MMFAALAQRVEFEHIVCDLLSLGRDYRPIYSRGLRFQLWLPT